MHSKSITYKILILLFVVCSASTVAAQTFSVIKATGDTLRIRVRSAKTTCRKVVVGKTNYCQLEMNGYGTLNTIGQPALPSLNKIIEIPMGKGIASSVETIAVDTISGETIGLTEPIVPVQPSRSKQDTSSHRAEKDIAIYTQDTFFGANTAEAEAIGISRDSRLARVTFNPVRWNPVTNKLIIIKEAIITITVQQADMPATLNMKRLHGSRQFNTHVAASSVNTFKLNTSICPERYLIIAHKMFRGALSQFVEWKKRKGFIVDVVYTDNPNVGDSTESIKTFLKSQYDNATPETPAPTYVLLVGDVEQIPTFYNLLDDHYSDLPYFCWTDGDYLPDCYYGRFSAQTIDQLTPQIEKTLLYEQYMFPNPSYLGRAVLIAGVDESTEDDWAYNYADPSMDYVAKTYINRSNGYNQTLYLKNNTGFAPAGVSVSGGSQTRSTIDTLRAIYNRGVGYVNYSGHGNTTIWESPRFNNNDVARMTNIDMPIVAVGNCCLTNSLQVSTCFGEALLRKPNGAGAVVYIGASNLTYWTEDFYWTVGVRTTINNTVNTSYTPSALGMYDKWFHTHGETVDRWATTIGAMVHAGNMSVENSNSMLKEYYWQIYNIMGDPSIMPYFGEAQSMKAQVPSTAVIGMSSLDIIAEPYSYVAFTDSSLNLLAATYANAFGEATLTFSPLTEPGNYEIVITSQDFIPFIQNVEVGSENGYISVTSLQTAGTPTAGDSVRFDATVKNIGMRPIDSISMELLVDNSHLLVGAPNKKNIVLPHPLQPGEEIELKNISQAVVLPWVADSTKSTIKAIATWGRKATERSRSFHTINIAAPSARLATRFDGKLTSENDSATLSVNIQNCGQKDMIGLNTETLCLDPSIIIDSAKHHISSLAAGHDTTIVYTLRATQNLPSNYTIPIIHTIRTATHTFTDTINITHGDILQNITFEDNTWESLPWQHGDYPWHIDSDSVFEGMYSLRSYRWESETGGNKKSTISLTWTSTIDDSISFYRLVSSEENYDIFNFYIDSTLQDECSGTNNKWTRVAKHVPAGTHTFTFSYDKDWSQKRGLDCAWIDNLHLPQSGEIRIYSRDTICHGTKYSLNNHTFATDTLIIGTHQITMDTGDVHYYLTLTVAEKPLTHIDYSSSEIERGETIRLKASGASRYIWNNKCTSSIIDVQPEETTTFMVTGYSGQCRSADSVRITVDIPVEIESLGGTPKVKIYPNPARDYIVVEMENLDIIEIFDISGRKINEKIAQSNSVKLHISQLNKGTYILKYTTKDGLTGISKITKM